LKNTITILAITIITAISFNFATAQYSESFENTFYPTGWSGKGWTKSNSKHKTGSYSAMSDQNDKNGSDNYLSILNVDLSTAASFSISYRGNNGNKNTKVSVFVINSSVNGGDSVLVTTLSPNSNSWTTTDIIFPEAYQNTVNNKIYFVINKITNGNDKVFIDDVNANFPMPVKMESFASSVNGNNVKLNWKTAEETNNKGFEIQRNSNNGWVTLGFVSANTSRVYNYSDNNIQTGTYQYRLKQVDFNGNFEYHTLSTTISIGAPSKYSLSQNYPNPFNPSTKISYQISKDEMVTLKIYDNTGREVASLVSEIQTAGYHTVEFKSNLSSGTYFYKIVTGSFTDTKKMTVIK
jgi:hypothetical protein